MLHDGRKWIGIENGNEQEEERRKSFKYGFCIKLQFKLTFEWKVIA